jgi:hypothetical protein
MRIMLLAILLSISTMLRALAPEPELNAQALATQMAVLHPHLDINLYASGKLKADSAIEYNTVRHDPEKLQAAIDRIASTVKARRAAREPQPELRFDTLAEIKSFTAEGGRLYSDLGGGSAPINQYGRTYDGYLPSSFLLLFPNYRILHSIEVPQEFAETAKARLANQDSVPVHLSVYFKLLQFQQRTVAQAVITRFVAYADEQRTIKIGERTETRDGAKLVRDSLLAEGLTLDVSPDHSNVVDGQYMLEYFIDPMYPPGSCKKQKPLRGHRVLDCVRVRAASEGVEPERVVHRFVGGRRVQVDFFEVAPRKDASVEKLRESMQMQYNRQFDPKQNKHRWSDGTSIFEIDFAAMTKLSKNPKLRVRAQEYQDMLDGKPGFEVLR